MRKVWVKKQLPWWSIFTLMGFYFPVGIALMVRKVTTERWRYAENGRVLKTFAYILFGVNVFYVVMGLAGEIEVTSSSMSVMGGILSVTLIVGGGGLLSYVKGKRYAARGRVYSDCKMEFLQTQVLEITPVASRLGISYEEAVKDLQAMIDAGCFADAYIDQTKRRILPKPVHRDVRTVICQNCGGRNAVETGVNAKCEYCDSPLF